MDNEKFGLIVGKLLEKTQKGDLEWEKTTDKDTFLTVLKDIAISVKKVTVKNPSFEDVLEPPYVFDLRNENGDVVDSITVPKSNENKYDQAKEIFDLASKQSLKNDSIVDRILEQLAT